MEVVHPWEQQQTHEKETISALKLQSLDANVEDLILRERNNEAKDIADDLDGLKEITSALGEELQVQAPLLDKIETTVQHSNQEVVEGVKDLVKAAKLQKKSYTLKVALAGGAAGGIIGACIGAMGGPPGAMVGALVGTTVCSAIGGGVGKAATEHAEYSIDKEILTLENQNTWIPDEDAPLCMKCSSKFSGTLRRHHCRMCGRVLCKHCIKKKLIHYEGLQRPQKKKICLDCMNKHSSTLGMLSQQ